MVTLCCCSQGQYVARSLHWATHPWSGYVCCCQQVPHPHSWRYAIMGLYVPSFCGPAHSPLIDPHTFYLSYPPHTSHPHTFHTSFCYTYTLMFTSPFAAASMNWMQNMLIDLGHRSGASVCGPHTYESSAALFQPQQWCPLPWGVPPTQN